MGVYIGVDVGGTHIKVAAVGTDAAVHAQTRIETRDSIADTREKTRYWLKAIREASHAVAEDAKQERLGIGIAAPGLVSRNSLVIESMPGRLQGLEQLNWTDALEQPKPVPVMNDAQAALLAESWTGAAVDARNAVLLTLGTGVGGALLVEGRIARGHIGRAGHLGHISLDMDGTPDICGAPGSLELMVGQATLPERSNDAFSTYEELLQAVRQGNGTAQEVWKESVRALAVGIISLINVLDPEVILLGGGIAAASELSAPLASYLDTYEWRPSGHAVPVRPAKLGSYGGAIGAARNAMLYNEPPPQSSPQS
jgi:glucokinase